MVTPWDFARFFYAWRDPEPTTEISMAQRVLIPYDELKEAKGICYSKSRLARLEKANLFPKRVVIGGKITYVETEIDEYVAQKIAARDAAVAAVPDIVQRDD